MHLLNSEICYWMAQQKKPLYFIFLYHNAFCVCVRPMTSVWARSPGFHPNCSPAPRHPPTLWTAPGSRQARDSASPHNFPCCYHCFPPSAVCLCWSTLHLWYHQLMTHLLCHFSHWALHPSPPPPPPPPPPPLPSHPPPSPPRSRGGWGWCCFVGPVCTQAPSPRCGLTPRWWSGFSLGFPWCLEAPSLGAAARQADREEREGGRRLCSCWGGALCPREDWQAGEEKEKGRKGALFFFSFFFFLLQVIIFTISGKDN